MSLDNNDGSDMELDSDTSPEIYYSHNSIVTTYNQYSKPSSSPNLDENNVGLNKSLSNDKKDVSTYSSQSKNVSLQSSNNGINEFNAKSPVNPKMSSNILSQSSPFNINDPQLPSCPPPENAMKILSQPLSPFSGITSVKAILALNTTSRPKQPMSGFPLKYSVAKLSTRDNVSNGPTPLEKHDRIRFELKSKNKLVDKLPVILNTSAKKASNVLNKNDGKLNAYGANSTRVNKSSSFSVAANSTAEKLEFKQDKSERNSGYKQVIDDGPNKHITAKKDINKEIVIDDSSGLVEKSLAKIGKYQNQRQIHIKGNSSSDLIKESIIIEKNLNQQQDQVVDNNTTKKVGKNTLTIEKNSDQQWERVDTYSNSIISIEKDHTINNENLPVKNSEILKVDQDQKKDQVDDNTSKTQESNLENFQNKQVRSVGVKHQNTKLKLMNKCPDLIQDIAGSKPDESIATVDRVNSEIQNMDIGNGDDKDMECPKLTTIKSDLTELDQDHKINKVLKADMIENNRDSSTEGKENEIKDDKLGTNNIQYIPKIKDKDKKMANKVVGLTNQTVESSSKTVETTPHEITGTTNHIDHLTNLMSQFTNEINQNSHQDNNQSQSTSRPINQATQHTKKIVRPISHVTQPTQKIDQPNNQLSQNASQMMEETIDAAELSNEVVEKYHELDNILLEFDEIAKKTVNAYIELHKLLPEGTVIRIDPPSTYKWDVITSMFGITDVNKLEKYISEDNGESKGKNDLGEEKANMENETNKKKSGEEETSEDDEEDFDVPSDDPYDKNFKCRSTILKQPNAKRWHNTRSNRPSSVNLHQRTEVDPDSSNTSTSSIMPNSSLKKQRAQATPKRTLRTRKGEEEEDDDTSSISQKRLDLDKYYEDGKPRRPANGFSYFCGDMCAKVRNEKLPISGTIAYAAEIWKKMTDEEKRPWLDRGAKSKIEYQELLNKWKEEQEELKTSSVKKRTISPKAKSGSSSKKPRND